MSIEETYNWTDAVPADGRERLKSLFDSGKKIAMAYQTQAVDGQSVIQHCFGYKSLNSYIIHNSIIGEDRFLGADLGPFWFLDPRPMVLEPSPLKWHYYEMNEEAMARVGENWAFFVWNDGDWEVRYDGECIGGGETKGGFDTAKAAVYEWRVNHLKSMIQQ